MREPIENEYFNWLCAKVQSVNVRVSDTLMRILHDTEFVWIHPSDKNRAEDGLELRTYFLQEANRDNDDPQWYNMPCSILELLIGFSFRAAFQTDMPARDWIHIFLRNLGLEPSMVVTGKDELYVRDILDRFIWRTYDSNGHGGLFPLRQTNNDQREVEIWYQFCEYLDDQGLN